MGSIAKPENRIREAGSQSVVVKEFPMAGTVRLESLEVATRFVHSLPFKCSLGAPKQTPLQKCVDALNIMLLRLASFRVAKQVKAVT